MVMRQAPPGPRLFPELLPHRSEPPISVGRSRRVGADRPTSYWRLGGPEYVTSVTTYETEVVPEPHFASTVTCRGMPLLR